MTNENPVPDSRLADWFRAAAPAWHDAVLPAYPGGSVANLVASILDAFNVPTQIRYSGLLPPVGADLFDPGLIRGARVIMLVVIDGLGLLHLQRAAGRGDVPALGTAHHAARLTSVFPPTTAAATTSLQNGVPPGLHGMSGYTLYIPEIDEVLNMITWRVAGKPGYSGPVPEPESFLQVPTAYETLGKAGIDTAIVSSTWFEDSALTRAQASGVRFRGYKTLSEFPRRLIREVERPGKRFVFGYWDGFDAVGHPWSSDSDVARLELQLVDTALGRGLFDRLRAMGEDVAVIVTADHGHIAIPRDNRFDLALISGLTGRWRHRPTGEARALGMALADQSDRARIATAVDGDGVVLDTGEAISAGLYGSGKHHPQLVQRVGDTLLLARGNASFSFPDSNTGSIGGHGSLTASEMLVPLLVWRFR